MTAQTETTGNYRIIRDGIVVQTFDGSAEAALFHMHSLQRRHPDSFWDLERGGERDAI